MDPIADKMLVNTLLIVLLVKQAYAPQQISVPLLAVIIMIARDLVVDGLRLVASERKIVLAANIFGKVKTVLQMAAISVFFYLMTFFLTIWRDSLCFARIDLGRRHCSVYCQDSFMSDKIIVLKDEKHG